MLIIHPQDFTTKFLEVLYPPEENIILDERASNGAIKRALMENTRIMLLGHGCETGLLAPFGKQQFGRLIIGPSHAQFLRGKTIIGIFCNANQFAYRYNLTGLFSGMVISEMSEALEWSIKDCTYTDIYEGRRKWAEDLHETLYGDLKLVPEKMIERPRVYRIDDFNYNSLYWIENGEDPE